MIRVRQAFTFTGGKLRFKYKTDAINHNLNGCNGFIAYFKNESTGQIPPTRHPNILNTLFTVKASLNFQINEWAEDRASGLLPRICFDDIVKELQLPEWVVRAVENQKVTYYK